MADFDSETFSEHTVLIGLLTREQVRQAMNEAENGMLDSLTRSMLRKGFLTSWQVERLKKGEVTGFIYGGCKVLFHIAEGTFARVYRGVKVPGGQSVAVKVLRHRFISDAAAVVRFNQEAEAGMKLIHPNIVRTFDYGEEDNHHYMIMEFVEGANLREFLKARVRLKRGGVPAVDARLGARLEIFARTRSDASRHQGDERLGRLQRHGEACRFRLGDDRGGRETHGAAHGQRTVDYSALERSCGSPKGDPRSDIFFMGCVFYQMLTGALPMPEAESKDPLAKMLRRSFGAIKPLGEMRNVPPPEMVRIIEKMMQMDLKKRYQNMEEVVGDLEAYHSEVQSAMSAPPPEAKPAKAAPAPAPPSIAPETPNPSAAAAAAVAKNASADRARDVAYDEGEFELKAAVEKPPKRILCVEAQESIRDAFRKTLARMGYRVLLVSSTNSPPIAIKKKPPISSSSTPTASAPSRSTRSSSCTKKPTRSAKNSPRSFYSAPDKAASRTNSPRTTA